ncbi:MAG: SpoIIE family protein phosphatase [Acidobacteriota bacterium]
MPSILTRWRNRLARGAPADDPWSASRQSPPIVLASLMRTLPGRLLLLTSGLLLFTVGLQFFVTLPPFADLFRKVVSLAWLGGVAWIVILAISRNRRAFLWRVRRKLLLSYLFLGVVPVVLSTAFALAFGVLLYVTVTSYVFLEGYGDTVEDLHQIAETSAIEIGRNPSIAAVALQRKFANLAATYPELSMAAVSLASGEAIATAGPWTHAAAPDAVPNWIRLAAGFSGTLPLAASPAHGPALVIRSAVPTADGSHFVVADLPLDAAMIGRLRERTGTGIEGLVVSGCGVPGTTVQADAATRQTSLFRETVAFIDCTAWSDGDKGRVAVHLVAPVAGLYDRLAAVGATPVTGTFDFSWSVLVTLLKVLGALFLIVQGSAFVMGAVLAKSITSAVHELFVGTERVQQGDFAHRITIESRDQLGELADSFNRMSASIEHLLHVQREKQRLDDELRIAREIQKSLLPVQPPRMAGLDIAALCEPAREVGGDYYDFFELGPGVLGVLVADVSGKGTSAALYMAELKGIILALSHTETSPRALLIQVNQLLADHLDNRSFITMTYAVLDMHAGTLTSARAGHTPLMVVSGGQSEVIMSDGMVLGLRLPGATERFPEILAEHTRAIVPGDIVVLYTDGITEAMDRTGEMFGDAALARVLRSQPELGATAIRERVLREVRTFVGDAEPHDDMTMVVLKIEPVTP